MLKPTAVLCCPLFAIVALGAIGPEGAASHAAERKGLCVRPVPLARPAMAGRPLELKVQVLAGQPKTFRWEFGDGSTAEGTRVLHTFARPGIYRIRLIASDGSREDHSGLIVRVHSPETLHVPQVFLDTDQKNEQDDQHYLSYALFSQLDVLGVNSVHHGGGQEPINYAEILHIIELARRSGLPEHRVPLVFRGANERLKVPASGRWQDTRPIETDASRAILMAARGAAPQNPLWVVPVGPGTNVASAVLLARREGLELKDRMRVMWLGGSNTAITGEFNGNNDPWSMYVVAQSGLETWIVPAPVGARVSIDKRTEGHLYADHPLGRYLKQIVPARNKPLFDPSALAAIIGMHLDLGWVREVEPVTVAGPEEKHAWKTAQGPTAVHVIRQIDQQEMKQDIFETIKGRPRRLLGVSPQR